MSGNQRDLDAPGEKSSAMAGAGQSERPRSISGSPPPTDDLDSEWDASPAAPEPAPEKRPSVRPAAVVVRTRPPLGTVAAGTSSETTLLGVAPPPIVPRFPKSDPPPRAESAPVPQEAEPADEPATLAPEPPAAAESAPMQPTPAHVEQVSAVEAAAPAKRAETPPDSVSASSTDSAERMIAESTSVPEARRSKRGLWIAAGVALTAGALWFGLRPSSHQAPTEPVARAAAPSPPQPPPSPAPVVPPPAVAADPAPVPSAAGNVSAAADGKRVVIVKVRPANARFFHKGKKVGVSPLRVELMPGEKRSFEVGHPNFVTRKVIVDGSEPEMTVGLYPKSGYPNKAPQATTEPEEGAP